jgi:predicted dehydrogenase
VGLVGCGGIGQLRAAALARTPSLTLVAAADADRGRAEALAAKHRIRVERDVGAIAGAADVDAVIVSTPPVDHAAAAVAALTAGKHVLCEKPLARDACECRTMIDAARRAGRALATGFNFRFFPSVRRARALLDAGAVGQLIHVRGYSGYWQPPRAHPAWLRDSAIAGGGTLWDNGIHLIDLVCDFLGDTAGAHVTGAASGPPGSEEQGWAIVRNRAGQVGSLQSSWTDHRGYRFTVDLIGTGGSIRVRCFPMTTTVWRKARRTSIRRHYLFPRTFVMEQLRSYRWVVVESLVAELDAFLARVDGRPAAGAGGADGLRSIEIAETAVAGGWYTLPDAGDDADG